MSSFGENLTYLAGALTSFFTASGIEMETILDPLTTIIRIISLCSRPEKTKLTFYKYSIGFDYPTEPLNIQGVKRKFSGKFLGNKSTKNDLAILKNTILLFIKENDMSDPLIKKFAEGAISGLTKLMLCYKKRTEEGSTDDPIVHCIEFYISILRNGLLNPKEKIEFMMDLKTPPGKKEQVEEQAEEQTEKQTEEQIGEQADEHIDERAEEQTGEEKEEEKEEDNYLGYNLGEENEEEVKDEKEETKDKSSDKEEKVKDKSSDKEAKSKEEKTKDKSLDKSSSKEEKVKDKSSNKEEKVKDKSADKSLDKSSSSEEKTKDKTIEKEEKLKSIFRGLWTQSEKMLVHGLLVEIEKQCETKDFSGANKLLEALEIILQERDKLLEKRCKKEGIK